MFALRCKRPSGAHSSHQQSEFNNRVALVQLRQGCKDKFANLKLNPAFAAIWKSFASSLAEDIDVATPPRSLTDRRRSATLVPPPRPVRTSLRSIISIPNQIVAPEVPVSRLPGRLIYDFAKRLFDLTVAVAVMIPALPFMAVIAVLLRIDSPGPIFIRQERLGKDTRPFRMFKFRTMLINSGQLPRELLDHNESSGPLFKMRNDPRITRLGRLLRRGSIDELPQLFNVLLGQMSLVGPRPPLARELEGYDPASTASRATWTYRPLASKWPQRFAL